MDDDPGGGIGDDLGAFGDLAISSKTSASFVSSSLTTGISLLSLSGKSAVDVVGDLDVRELRYWAILLFALRDLLASCAIPPPAACGGWTLDLALERWSAGCDVCC